MFHDSSYFLVFLMLLRKKTIRSRKAPKKTFVLIICYLVSVRFLADLACLMCLLEPLHNLPDLHCLLFWKIQHRDFAAWYPNLALLISGRQPVHQCLPVKRKWNTKVYFFMAKDTLQDGSAFRFSLLKHPFKALIYTCSGFARRLRKSQA